MNREALEQMLKLEIKAETFNLFGWLEPSGDESNTLVLYKAFIDYNY